MVVENESDLFLFLECDILQLCVNRRVSTGAVASHVVNVHVRRATKANTVRKVNQDKQTNKHNTTGNYISR